MTWYQRLICSLNIPKTGGFVSILDSLLATGMFEKKTIEFLDTSIAVDVTDWFNHRFKSWFEEAVQILGGHMDFTSLDYVSEVNRILQSLHVARSFYTNKANQEFVSSLQEVARKKAQICEEIISAMETSYLRAIEERGYKVEFRPMITDSSSFAGSLPENFRWNGPGVLKTYHNIFSSVVKGDQEPVPGEENYPVPGQIKTIVKKSNTPWLVAAAFGFIAWRATGKKKKQ